MMDHNTLNLKKVINASGKMTILGVSTVSDQVLEAQRFGALNFFEMSALFEETGAYIAKCLQTEDAQIVASASAGIALSVAALIGQGERYHVYHPYSEKYTKREIIIPKGHNVDYGTPVETMIQLGGGTVVEAGYANMCTKEHIEMQLTDKTAAIMYVKSHHAVQKSMLSTEDIIAVAKKHHVPIIIDAAAEEDLLRYTKQGADLVIYSGAKAIEGPSSGFVIGKKDYIRWVRMQNNGIGRSMKVGKENVIGLTQAITDYLKKTSVSVADMKRRLTPFVAALNDIDNISACIVQDAAGRDIYRAEVYVSKPVHAAEIVEKLKEKSPAVYTREYRKNSGYIEFDIRAISETDMQHIVSRLTEIMTKEGF